MLTSEFNSLLRQYEDHEMEKFERASQSENDPEYFDEDCKHCTPGRKCLRCGFGYGGIDYE